MFVIAHRGANKLAPQNTIHAFLKAAELKSDGVETDVHVTKDGELVLCHNGTVDKTSNGRGRISDMSLSDLKRFDFGSWFGRRFKNTTIPTLDEFLQTMKDTAVSVLNIELKPQKGGRLDFVDTVIQKAKEYGLADKLFISSFDYRILDKAKSLEPCVRTGYLYPAMGDIIKRKLFSPMNIVRKYNIDYLLPHQGYVSKKLIEKAHDAGKRVAVWTVNKLETAEKLSHWGADGVITDFPDIIKNKLESI